MKTSVNVAVTLQEWDTMLAALRAWQGSKDSVDFTDNEAFAQSLAREHGKPLNGKQIDALIERIQFSPEPALPVIVVEGGIVQNVFRPTPREAEPFVDVEYDLVDFDIFEGNDDEDIARHWNALEPSTQECFKNHLKDEYKQFKQVLDRIARGKRDGLKHSHRDTKARKQRQARMVKSRKEGTLSIPPDYTIRDGEVVPKRKRT